MKVIITTIALIVVVGIGFGAYCISGEQQRDYDKGHAAYLEGNCADAVGHSVRLRMLTMTRIWRARAEVEECEALLTAGALDAQGEQSAAVLSYSEFVTTYSSSAIVSVALTKGQALIAAGQPEHIGSLPLCTWAGHA